MVRILSNYLICKISLALSLTVVLSLLASCQTAVSMKPDQPVILPFIKNNQNECYYLDEFMPVPDNVVSGRSGSVALRYYTYKTANYKDWQAKQIVLSFYSKDDRCWSLFEEYYVRN